MIMTDFSPLAQRVIAAMLALLALLLSVQLIVLPLFAAVDTERNALADARFRLARMETIIEGPPPPRPDQALLAQLLVAPDRQRAAAKLGSQLEAGARQRGLITPRVNDSGTVTLDISQEVSEVAQTTTSGINSPTIQQRRLSSTVATRSGQMIALGGLIRERNSQTRAGIPLLSQIPIIGGLFGRHQNLAGRTELIILLTPTVVRAPEDVGAVVDELLGALDATRPLVERARETQLQGRDAQQPAP